MEPIPKAKRPKYLSPSAIGTLEQCPFRFKLQKIDKVKEAPTEEQLLGIFVHEVLENLLKVEPPEGRTEEKAKAISRQLWDRGWEGKVRKVVAKSEINDFRWKTWWCLENYFRLEDPTALAPKGLEEWLDFTVEGVRMKGVIDRWLVDDSGRFVVTDYKTGKTPDPRYRDDKVFQLAVYAYGLEQQIDHPIDEIEWLYLKDGDRIRLEVEPSHQTDMVNIVTSAWKELNERCESGDFPTKKSRLCDWCGFKSNGMCPAWSQ
jgi:putative RecB family exonuclease